MHGCGETFDLELTMRAESRAASRRDSRCNNDGYGVTYRLGIAEQRPLVESDGLDEHSHTTAHYSRILALPSAPMQHVPYARRRLALGFTTVAIDSVILGTRCGTSNQIASCAPRLFPRVTKSIVACSLRATMNPS